MRCKHLPQDNANVSITYAKQKHKSLCLKNRIGERERVGISKTKQRNVKPNLLLFGLFTLHDCLASPDWNLPPRRTAIYQKAKAFCKPARQTTENIQIHQNIPGSRLPRFSCQIIHVGAKYIHIYIYTVRQIPTPTSWILYKTFQWVSQTREGI